MEKPIVLAWKNRLLSDTPGQWGMPSDWVYPVKYNDRRSYMVETARVVYDHAGFLLCGSEIPMFELKRDKSLTGKGHTCFSCMFVFTNTRRGRGNGL